METSWIGRPLKRYEDIELLQGKRQFVADINRPNLLYAFFVRSPYANARIKRILTDIAHTVEGVVAIITGEDIAQEARPLSSFARLGDSPVKPVPHPVLARDRVRYVGEPVAVILAESPHAAEDAGTSVAFEAEIFTATADPLRALKTDSALVHEDLGTNLALEFQLEGGEIARAFAEADLVVSHEFHVPRVAASPIEPRGCIAEYDSNTGMLTMWSSTQVPHRLRSELSNCLGMEEAMLHVIAPEVGGAFGSKSAIYPEEVAVALLAKKFGRPVKWVEERRENLVAAAQGRGQFASYQVAVRKDGTLLALSGEIVADLGAYFLFTTCVAPVLTSLMATGPYRIPNVAIKLQGVFTNKVPLGTYRGAGRPEAIYYLERMLDIIASRLELDPVELRRRNLIPSDSFPYTSATGVIYDSGNYERALDRGLEIFDYKGQRQYQRALREHEGSRSVGIGTCVYVELSGGIPLREGAKVALESDGRMTVSVGVAPQGQGLETTFRQIVAEELGIPPESITVRYKDSAIIPSGVGTFASRSLALGGSAIYLALRELKDKTKLAAAEALHAPPEALQFGHAGWTHRDTGAGISLKELAQKIESGPGAVANQIRFEVEKTFEPAGFTTSFGVHIAMVEIDGDSKEVKVLKYVAVDDCGTVINPIIVDGQVQGGVLQGISEGLWEQVVYDDAGTPLTGSLLSYAMPTAKGLPRIVVERTETPTQLNPLGAKGIGEAGATGAFAAVVNAVIDALRPHGVEHIDCPVLPEKIWNALRPTPQG
jgi:carbon-monoxide dehydrogenase large subunit